MCLIFFLSTSCWHMGGRQEELLKKPEGNQLIRYSGLNFLLNMTPPSLPISQLFYRTPMIWPPCSSAMGPTSTCCVPTRGQRSTKQPSWADRTQWHSCWLPGHTPTHRAPTDSLLSLLLPKAVTLKSCNSYCRKARFSYTVGTLLLQGNMTKVFASSLRASK